MKQVTERLQDNLRALFGDQYVVRAYYKENLGPHAVIVIHDTKPANGIWENSPVAVHLICHISDNFGRPLPEGSKLSWESLGHTRINFRKLSSTKGFEDLNDKLLKVLAKHKVNMDQILLDKGLSNSADCR